MKTVLTGILLLIGAFAALSDTHYANVNNQTPAAPYTSWETAAQTIQDAVDAAEAGDRVLVYDGVYSVGERDVGEGELAVGRSRVVVLGAIALASVNGPMHTVITGQRVWGQWHIRCAYLADGASLSGFTLTGGHAADRLYEPPCGGGVLCASANAFLTNCVLIFNRAESDYDSGSGGGVEGGTLCNCALLFNDSYSGGGAYSSILYNCTLATNSAFRGGGAERSTLYNCVLTGNRTHGDEGCPYDGAGAGASYATLYNCTLTGNKAQREGGGAYYSTLYNCALTGNRTHVEEAEWWGVYGAGGGAARSTLYNCTLIGNAARGEGGGAYGDALYNCILYYNIAEEGANYGSGTLLDHCCTTPLPPHGEGNIDQGPLFVDPAGGDYRLQLGSPCINAGLNQDWMVGATDLDGNPRISLGVVDIGAYEVADTDRDGVPDVIDACSGTPAGEVVNADGCSISQLVPASGPWKNHGQYVSAVARVAEEFLTEGLITELQKDQIVADAAKSRKPRNP